MLFDLRTKSFDVVVCESVFPFQDTRTLGPDEELLQVQARVVLAECAQHVQHAPVREHNLQPQHVPVQGSVPFCTYM